MSNDKLQEPQNKLSTVPTNQAVNFLFSEWIKALEESEILRLQLEQAQAANQKLVECLEWYADEDTWLEPDGAGILPIDYDEGQRARQTLSEVKGNG